MIAGHQASHIFFYLFSYLKVQYITPDFLLPSVVKWVANINHVLKLKCIHLCDIVWKDKYFQVYSQFYYS